MRGKVLRQFIPHVLICLVAATIKFFFTMHNFQLKYIARNKLLYYYSAPKNELHYLLYQSKFPRHKICISSHFLCTRSIGFYGVWGIFVIFKLKITPWKSSATLSKKEKNPINIPHAKITQNTVYWLHVWHGV